WMVVGEDYTSAASSPNHVNAVQIPACNAGDTLKQVVGPANMVIRRNGWIYIYLSNESAQDVYFDNLVINLKHGPLMEQKDYYPFGLENPGLSTKALKQNYYENRMKFNEASELQNKEFNDGSGLELYDFNARMYDPQIGRFLHVDPLANLDFNISSYAYASNDPILMNDPTGLANDTAWLPEVTVTGKMPLDTKNGQVYPARNVILNFIAGNRTWTGHQKLGNQWHAVQYLVDSRGYLTGKAAPNMLVFPDLPIGEKPLLSAKAILNIRNFIKGRYVVYRGVKNGLDYIGKARGGIEFRYTIAQARNLGVDVMEGLDNLPSNAVALGVEQLVIDLNGGAGTGELANKINATVKETYISEARYWLDTNLPNWEQTLKFK
ncbi:MAG: RHS repeat-associated core domain-containing protein, partial [Bacteroidota bacterium]|nr:RHS repeat-associated core domain-containing protein [Bacteroidota bacterium]